MSNEWFEGSIHDVILKKLVKHLDERGYLFETFRSDELPADLKPTMNYVSVTEPGIARGPHEHHEQTDIFAFAGPGNFKLKLWDNRSSSPTYRNWMELYAGQDKPMLVVIPPGIVHGYKNISSLERGMVLNFPDKLFMGPGKKELVDEIRHESDQNSPFSME